MHLVEFENCRDLCIPVVQWYMNTYIPDSLFFLVVEEKDLSEEGVDGWCMRETHNEFLIQIDENIKDPYTYKRVLLHELHHMWQYYHDKPRDEEETLRQEWYLLNKYHQNE
jgi:hypothetical protein